VVVGLRRVPSRLYGWLYPGVQVDSSVAYLGGGSAAWLSCWYWWAPLVDAGLSLVVLGRPGDAALTP